MYLEASGVPLPPHVVATIRPWLAAVASAEHGSSALAAVEALSAVRSLTRLLSPGAKLQTALLKASHATDALSEHLRRDGAPVEQMRANALIAVAEFLLVLRTDTIQ